MSSSERTDRATALITGASSGIGYQYARQLAARGYDLLIVSNDAEGIANSAAEIRKQYGVRITPLYRDLSAENAAEDLYRYCEDEQLDVEVLVNNAGVFFFDDLARVDSRRIELMLRLHVRTTTLLCHYFGRSMQARGRGYILNMSSMSAWMPFPGISVYAATKSYRGRCRWRSATSCTIAESALRQSVPEPWPPGCTISASAIGDWHCGSAS